MITSVITKTEVFECELSSGVYERYTNLLTRRNVITLDNDLRVAELAGKIREYYAQRKRIDGLDGITTPDAIHLATAIHYSADVFYTFDDGKKAGSKGRSLLSLNGNVAGHELHIKKPIAKQYRLFSSDMP